MYSFSKFVKFSIPSSEIIFLFFKFNSFKFIKFSIPYNDFKLFPLQSKPFEFVKFLISSSVELKMS